MYYLIFRVNVVDIVESGIKHHKPTNQGDDLSVKVIG
jgi:hypothetical protein